MKTMWSISNGFVIGDCWGGGRGFYPARKIGTYETKKALMVTIRKMLVDGSLDSGMGYESVTGAVLEIKKTRMTEIKGETFSRNDYDMISLGKMSDSERDAMMEQLFL